MTSPQKLVLVTILAACIFQATSVAAQCRYYISVNSERVLVEGDDAFESLRLPVWLRETETLAADLNVRSISIIEFNEVGSQLEYSQVVRVTTQQMVPVGRVWKIESILKAPTLLSIGRSITFSTPGVIQWAAPSCVNYVCIEVWGGGGGGGGGTRVGGSCTGGFQTGGGGAGGGYGQQCFDVTPGMIYPVTVGAGGSGGGGACGSTAGSGNPGQSSSVASLISATGGAGGGGATTSVDGAAGTPGGTSTATTNAPGSPATGATSGLGANNAAIGGLVGNGGNGGIPANSGAGGQAGRVTIVW